MVKLKHIDFQVPNWGEWAGGPQSKLGYHSLVLADNPAGYWRLGEVNSSTAADEMGANDFVVASGVTLGQQGLLTRDNDRSADFDGTSNAHMTKTSPTSMLDPQADQSIECWIRVDDLSDLRTLMARYLDSNTMFNLRVGTNGRLQATWRLGGANYGYQSPIGTIATGTLYHIAATISTGNAVTLYTNGVSVNSSSIGSLAVNSPSAFHLGSRGATTRLMDGIIDEAALYNRELSAAEILAHYKVGIGKLIGT